MEIKQQLEIFQKKIIEQEDLISTLFKNHEAMAHTFRVLEEVESQKEPEHASDIIIKGIEPPIGIGEGAVFLIKEDDGRYIVSSTKGRVPERLKRGIKLHIEICSDCPNGLCEKDVCPVEGRKFKGPRHVWKMIHGDDIISLCMIWGLITDDTDFLAQYFRVLFATSFYSIMTRKMLRETNSLLKEKLREVNELRQDFETLVSTLPDIVYKLDVEGHFTYINDSIKELGYDPKEMIGEHFQKIISLEDYRKASRREVLPRYKGQITGDKKAPGLFDERRTGKRGTRRLEVKLISRNGKRKIPGELIEKDMEGIIGEVNSSGLWEVNPRDGKKVMLGSVGVIRDITERKLLEVKLFNLMNQLKEASEAKSNFLASVSHELRTPLNAIIGFSQLLLIQSKDRLNETEKDYVNNILISGRHLLSLIDDILDLSKIEAGEMKLEISPISIEELFEQSVIMIKEKCIKHGISCETQIDDELKGEKIHADLRKMKQIMFNLLSNASKFTPDGGKIRVSARLVEEELELTVSDTGPGIRKEEQEMIFEPFYQTKDHYYKKEKGAGLGLSLTKRLVELHGGSIWVESEPGKGSTFYVRIKKKVR